MGSGIHKPEGSALRRPLFQVKGGVDSGGEEGSCAADR
jgi:hypothetical protein